VIFVERQGTYVPNVLRYGIHHFAILNLLNKPITILLLLILGHIMLEYLINILLSLNNYVNYKIAASQKVEHRKALG
jgi:hypothetical protein